MKLNTGFGVSNAPGEYSISNVKLVGTLATALGRRRNLTEVQQCATFTYTGEVELRCAGIGLRKRPVEIRNRQVVELGCRKW
jgi:hypothetical protein